MLTSVVLPAPFGPISACTVPGAMQQFRYQGQKCGAKDWSGQGPGASEQDRQQKENRIDELKVVRIDEILQMRKQRAAASGKHRADDEYHDFLAMDVDADRRQGRLVEFHRAYF